MKTILMKFASPLQSWGSGSDYNIRKTDLYPSKSAVIGIISAAMGYGRDEDEKIEDLNKLDFGVRCDQIGGILRDFQTAKHEVLIKRAYLIDKYYLEDSIFLVAIGSEDKPLMKKIEEALKDPYYPLFLGRRSVPINADFFIETNDKNIVDNLKNYEWLAKDRYKKKNSNFLSVYVDSDVAENENKVSTTLRRDRVLSFSQKQRVHSFRSESRFEVEVENKVRNFHSIFEVVEE